MSWEAFVKNITLRNNSAILKIKKTAKSIVFAQWKNKKKDEKSSDAIATTNNLSNNIESNYTCYSIAFFSKFEFCIIECNDFFLIRSEPIVKLYEIKDHWALFLIWFETVMVIQCLTDSIVYLTHFSVKAGV